jgi:hypothetical protein
LRHCSSSLFRLIVVANFLDLKLGDLGERDVDDDVGPEGDVVLDNDGHEIRLLAHGRQFIIDVSNVGNREEMYCIC